MSHPLPPPGPQTRYRFADFVLAPAERKLLSAGREVPLIPRYFDLLVLLVERRQQAVHRREMLEKVWSDVVVSDGAVSQAVRTLRRTLGDDGVEPAFIRTVSRYGYQFIHPEVSEEAGAARPAAGSTSPPSAPAVDPFEAALARLLAVPPTAASEDDGPREAAETLHTLGTAEALRRLGRRPGHQRARALLRDTRWDVAGAGPVPLLGAPGGPRALGILLGLRLRRAARLAESRWAAASGGGATTGVLAGILGGLVLLWSPGSQASASILVGLALVGGVVGGVGAAGVGAGLAVAEVLVRSYRRLALVLFGALGGGAVGLLAHLLARSTLQGVFGQGPAAIGGGLEGVGLGAAAGLGYALATPRPEGGMASPRGWARLWAALVTGLSCALGGLALTASGANLAGASLNLMARSFQGSQVRLAPLARLLGEPDLGPTTRSVLGAWEGGIFGSGLAFGLTRRPRQRPS
ncbi:MAG TPA: winged helix-turn-helix domain-containing protein [Vicinamibacteria bacterium]|nr:winged helix-turn-helix domain-containing protein [Vicinamibacteria bacterium]